MLTDTKETKTIAVLPEAGKAGVEHFAYWRATPESTIVEDEKEEAEEDEDE